MTRSTGIHFAVFGLLLACLGEAVGFPLVKAFALCSGRVAPGVSGWFVTALLLAGRFLVAALMLCCFERKLPTKSELSQGLWLGAFAGGGNILLADGLSSTNASTGAFLTHGYVLVLPLLGAIESRTLPERRVVWAVCVSLVGIAMLARFDPRTLSLGRGEAETLLAALLFAGQIFSLSRPRYVDNEAGPVTMVMFLSVGLGSLPLAVAAARPQDFDRFIHAPGLWLLLGLMAICSTLLPFVLMNHYQRHVSSSEAGVIYGAEPVLASVLALFLPAGLSQVVGIRYENEQLTLRLLVGATLVSAAALLLRARANPASVKVPVA